MNTNLMFATAIRAPCLLFLAAGLTWSEEPSKSVEPSAPAAATTGDGTPQQAMTRALEFLEKDAAKWRQEKGCATCHHGVLTVWAFSEAKQQGFTVSPQSLDEVTRWTKDRFVPNFAKPRDSRPGWSLVSVPTIYLGVMSQNLPILSRDELNGVALHLSRHMESDGTWALPPPANGAPPIWESAETLALWALLAWEQQRPLDSPEAETHRANRNKAVAWLGQSSSSQTAQAIGLRLLFAVRSGGSNDEIQTSIKKLFGLQNSDGGWGQAKELASDAYATGQALWVLSCAGVSKEDPQVSRAVAFLVNNQREDGSWPMTSRNHAGVESTRNPIRNPIPITYFGSAWATIGLARSSKPVLELSERQKKAFDAIRAYGGSYEANEMDPQKPIIAVKIVYAVDDSEFTSLINLLTAFPQLTTLRLKSPRLTDAGIAYLKDLPQLSNLSLESSPITDAGIHPLKSLTQLKMLNLKGTKVTDVGAQEIKKALPNLKLER